ncbi:ABC transporter ATP-binding protein [candidate division KSB1 bacterium]|nr:ABC transporter ATP-binding protein [candidate division KSB1 bacterium]
MIEVRELERSFGDTPVLRGVSLTVETGESITIIGRSGCGKSVLLKHLVGLLKPDAGEILVDGHSIVHAKRKELYEQRKKFGVLFQGAALWDSMTVEENVGLALHMHKLASPSEIDRTVDECLAHVGLPNTRKLKPAELSGGMKKRVGLARAIAMRPRYILYDEPTTGLDPITADSINDLIIQMNQELDVTTIVVTHDMVSAYKVSSRIIMLHDGRVVHSGTPAETQNSSNELVRKFVNGESDDPRTVITHY